MIDPFKATFQLQQADRKILENVVGHIHSRGLAIFYEQDLNERKFVDLMKRRG